MRKVLVSILSIVVLSSSVFARGVNRKEFLDKTQEQILEVIRTNIRVSNTLIGDKYVCKVYCEPPIYLTAGNCFIDWVEERFVPYTQESAFDAAIQRYSLKSWGGKYSLEYGNDKITIGINANGLELAPSPYASNSSKGKVEVPDVPTIKGTAHTSKNTIINNQLTPKPTTETTVNNPGSNTNNKQYGTLGNYLVSADFECIDQRTMRQQIFRYYLYVQDFWNEAKVKVRELNTRGYDVVRYGPTNGLQELNYNFKYVPGPNG